MSGHKEQNRMARPPTELWGVKSQLVRLTGGYRNMVFRTAGRGPGRELVFKSTRRSEEALRWLIPVQRSAREVGFVVPELIAGRDGRLVQDGWTCERLVAGAPFLASEMAAVRPIVAALHGATAQVAQRPDFLSSTELIEALQGGDVDLRDMPADLVSCCRAAWHRVSHRGQAIVHGDINPGNLIRCADGRAALIDWDECRRDLVLFDMAVLQPADQDAQRARLAWEIACSWKVEPEYARHLASRL